MKKLTDIFISNDKHSKQRKKYADNIIARIEKYFCRKYIYLKPIYVTTSRDSP